MGQAGRGPVARIAVSGLYEIATRRQRAAIPPPRQARGTSEQKREVIQDREPGPEIDVLRDEQRERITPVVRAAAIGRRATNGMEIDVVPSGTTRSAARRSAVTTEKHPT